MFAVIFLVVMLGVLYSGRIRGEERRATEERAAVERDSLRRWFVAESTRQALEADSIRTNAAKWQAEGRARRDSARQRADCGLMQLKGTKSMAC